MTDVMLGGNNATDSRGELHFNKEENMKTKMLHVVAVIVLGLAFIAGPALAADKKPNILVIWGDDIGMWNVGAYTHGMMGRTPNIDSLAKNGAIFTDHYGQASCTAGRAAFITGQMPLRTGETTIGIPGSTLWYPEGRPDAGRGV